MSPARPSPASLHQHAGRAGAADARRASRRQWHRERPSRSPLARGRTSVPSGRCSAHSRPTISRWGSRSSDRWSSVSRKERFRLGRFPGEWCRLLRAAHHQRKQRTCRVMVNAGLEGAVDCAARSGPGARRVFIGYYRLYRNSTVEARAPSVAGGHVPGARSPGAEPGWNAWDSGSKTGTSGCAEFSITSRRRRAPACCPDSPHRSRTSPAPCLPPRRAAVTAAVRAARRGPPPPRYPRLVAAMPIRRSPGCEPHLLERLPEERPRREKSSPSRSVASSSVCRRVTVRKSSWRSFSVTVRSRTVRPGAVPLRAR